MQSLSGITLDLFSKRIDALYHTDPRGGLLGSNEWDSRPAPRFHLMRTGQGPVFRFRADLPDSLAHQLSELCSLEMADAAWERRPRREQDYLALLTEQAPVERIWAGPAYVAVHDAAPKISPLPIDEGNAFLLEPCFEDWLDDVPHRRPFMASLQDGRAVSICASVRISSAVHCAGVETHPDYRGKGHAVDAVAGWARAVCSLGAKPFYSTSWDNLASQGVAGRLGFALAGVDFHVT